MGANYMKFQIPVHFIPYDVSWSPRHYPEYQILERTFAPIYLLNQKGCFVHNVLFNPSQGMWAHAKKFMGPTLLYEGVKLHPRQNILISCLFFSLLFFLRVGIPSLGIVSRLSTCTSMNDSNPIQ